MRKIDNKTVERQIREIVFKFLNPKEYKVFIFGSRATGKAKKFSDYDIGILGKKPVPGEKMALTEEAFEESDLPFKIEVVDFSLVSSKFQNIALSKIKELQPIK